ncbi:unnamed protein product [Lactuca virosa]|uniref:AMP-dependent synthetase/ligase domain-containing protein n=1 Tax=Lactuca virosa TaxID=75947 RepID=A0AAU9N5C7_9ASTR|nr:unnamed protein product [Lactuca virosa]
MMGLREEVLMADNLLAWVTTTSGAGGGLFCSLSLLMVVSDGTMFKDGDFLTISVDNSKATFIKVVIDMCLCVYFDDGFVLRLQLPMGVFVYFSVCFKKSHLQLAIRKKKMEALRNPNEAKSSPLSPLGFLERATNVFVDSPSLVYDNLTYTQIDTFRCCLQLASFISGLDIDKGDVVYVSFISLPP